MDPQIAAQRTVPWGWLSATVISVLAIYGVEYLLYALTGFGLGLTGITSEAEVGRFFSNISVAFVVYALARMLGFAAVYAYSRSRGGKLSDLGFRKFKLSQAVKVIFLAFLSFAALATAVGLLIQYFLPSVDLEQAQELLFLNAAGIFEISLAFIALVIIAPISEEVIFRGFLLPAYRQSFGMGSAIIITSLMFGFLHMPLGVAIVISTFAIVLAWAYYKTDSLWPAIIIHSIKNLVAFTALFMS